MENDKSLVQINTSIARIEKQITIGEKILALTEQSFVLLINKKYYIQLLSINDYKNITENIVFNKKVKNIFIEDFIAIEFITRKSKIIFFTKLGKYFSSTFEKIMKMKNLNDLFAIEIQDEIIDLITYENTNNCKNLIFVTQNGLVKKTKIKLFTDEKLTSNISINLKENDFLVNVKKIEEKNEVVIVSKYGKLIRFDENKARILSKNTYGDNGINLLEEVNNIVIGFDIIDKFDEYILIVTEKGNIKKTEIDEYRITNRGGKGVKTFLITKRTGMTSHINVVQDKNCCLLITNLNNTVKFKISDLRVYGRCTEGRKIIKLAENERIRKIVKLPNFN